MNRRLIRTLAVFGFALPAMLSQAQASPVTYSSRVAWEAATSGEVNRNFEGYAGNGSFLGNFSDTGVAFSTSNNYMFTYGPASGYDIGSGKYIVGPWGPCGGACNDGNLTGALPSGTTSAGTDLALYTGGGTISVFVDLLNGTDFSTTANVPGFGQRGFFGLRVDGGDSIVSMRFTSPNGNVNLLIDNFATGNAVPEPATLLLLGTGLVGLGAVTRMRARRK